MRHTKALIACLCSLLITFTSSNLLAQKGTTGTIVDRVFTEVERQVIGEYYDRQRQSTSKKQKKHKKGKKQKGLPPGLAKRDRLPPGLEKQLQRNGHLPPGLEKRQLPDDLIARLPPRLRGHERVVVDDRVVLIEKASGLILDILLDAL